MAKADYKTKYLDIRAKYLESSDVAYRLGYADGLKDGAQQAQEQVMAEQQEQEQAMMGGGDGEMPPEMMGGEMPPEMTDGAPMGEAGSDEGTGDDMDSHISELENLVAKGEKPTILKMRSAIKSLRKAQDIKFSSKIQPKVATAQKKFVDSLIAKFDSGSKSVTEGLEDVIKKHGLKVD